MKTPTIEQVADFLKEATEGVLGSIECYTYHLDLTDRVSIVVAWEDGYDPEDSRTNKYIAKDGWGINWSLRLRESSYFVSDWDYLDERAGVTVCESDAEDGFTGLAKFILKEANDCHYLNPEILITLPDGREVDLLDDAYYVHQCDVLRNEKRDLTELWWWYHGWHWDDKETEVTLHLWVEHLAEYYGDFDEDFQQLISLGDLTEMIYHALIKEDWIEYGL